MTDAVGDGTKTAILLTDAFVRGGIEAVRCGHRLQEVLKGIDRATGRCLQRYRHERGPMYPGNGFPCSLDG